MQQGFMMSPIWICVFFLLAKPYPVYGGLGSVVSPSCPIKCDVFCGGSSHPTNGESGKSDQNGHRCANSGTEKNCCRRTDEITTN